MDGGPIGSKTQQSMQRIARDQPWKSWDDEHKVWSDLQDAIQKNLSPKSGRKETNRLKRAHRRKSGGTLKELLTGTGLPTRGRRVKKDRESLTPLRETSPADKRREQEARNRAFSP